MKQDRLLLKHAVGGKVLLDTAAEEAPYELSRAEKGGEWRLAIETPRKDWVQALLYGKLELNVFLFPAPVDGQPVRKLWFYLGEKGAAYDAEARKLLLSGPSHIEYEPSSFGFVN
ncbi:hypothetical protein ACFSL6_03705 [Paenibacillus thailandensis]|uniref:Uncharacterized protein n=1 Tax=Paenibacillus thailandensis TaxID=393250 RepID=A0ABW5R4B5_9BACL